MRTLWHHARARDVAALGLALGLSGCESLFEPDRLQGTYALASISATALPAVTFSKLDSMAGWETSVLADTLTFVGGGQGSWRSIQRRRDVASGAEETFEFALPFRYRLESGRLVVTFLDCSPECRAAFTERARRTSRDALSRDRGGEWQYVRVPR